jgi:hypothetical protein
MISMLDLVGLRYRKAGTDPAIGVDCLWAARAALSRIFPDLTDAEFPLDKAAALEVSESADAWLRVNGATQLGDVLFGLEPEPWVAVLVDPVGRYCFTANRTRGTHLVFQGNLGTVHSTFRRRATR